MLSPKKTYFGQNFFKSMKKHIIVAGLFFSTGFATAQQYGGMWIPTELNEKEMKQMGMKISAKDIFNPNKPSIKDAVVQYDGGCTAEIISPKGLLLTNHHCGYSEIQAHSTLEKDYLKNGFWAKNMNEELPNPGVTADFVIDIKEVTQDVLGNNLNLSEAEIKKNIEKVKASFKIEPYQKVVVKPMYYGNKYYAYIIETYKDVRLVGAPPSSIGKFGSDTDNWVFPRHTGDFALFRIYADKNNKPAEYSKDNIPYKPKHYLPISIKDKKEDDFTFVFGFPGRTQEYLPSIAVEKIMTEIDPAMIAMRDVTLKVLDKKMRTDDATRIKYASKYASIANAWKKWQGEVEGLKKSNAVSKKRAYEAELIKKNPNVKTTLEQLNKLYNQQAPYALQRAYYNELMRNSETFLLANILGTYASQKTTDNQSYDKMLDRLSKIYKDYDAELDAQVTAQLLHLYANKTSNELLPSGFEQFRDLENTTKIVEDWSKNAIVTGRKTINGKGIYTNINAKQLEALKETIANEPLVKILQTLKKEYSEKNHHKYSAFQNEIDALQKIFMAQQMETDKDRKFFPDANSTLRVAYGKVKGSNPKDALYYSYQTHLSGVMEKYIPGDYEFDVPKKLIDLYNKKDFGIYKNATGDVPVNFTATNHTTGGNSGSPALDAYGNLIGLNFDRQWEGTMSDINFDPRFSRNIMVDTKYILFIIDKYADAKWLLKEMKIVK